MEEVEKIITQQNVLNQEMLIASDLARKILEDRLKLLQLEKDYLIFGSQITANEIIEFYDEMNNNDWSCYTKKYWGNDLRQQFIPPPPQGDKTTLSKLLYIIAYAIVYAKCFTAFLKKFALTLHSFFNLIVLHAVSSVNQITRSLYFA